MASAPSRRTWMAYGTRTCRPRTRGTRRRCTREEPPQTQHRAGGEGVGDQTGAHAKYGTDGGSGDDGGWWCDSDCGTRCLSAAVGMRGWGSVAYGTAILCMACSLFGTLRHTVRKPCRRRSR